MNLPDDNDDCFVQFESICRRNMTQMIDENSTNDFERAVKLQYVVSVAAVALECNIQNINYDPDHDNFWQMFSHFSLAVQGEVARIRIRQRGERHPYSVLLTTNTRTKIEHYVDRIRDAVKNSDIDQERRDKLSKKLDELLKELDGRRLNFSTAMAILVTITATVAGATTIAADGKNAITNIMQLIGQDKQSEDEAAKRLSPPRKSLPPPKKNVMEKPVLKRNPNYDLDDDIPF